MNKLVHNNVVTSILDKEISQIYFVQITNVIDKPQKAAWTPVNM